MLYSISAYLNPFRKANPGYNDIQDRQNILKLNHRLYRAKARIEAEPGHVRLRNGFFSTYPWATSIAVGSLFYIVTYRGKNPVSGLVRGIQALMLVVIGKGALDSSFANNSYRYWLDNWGLLNKQEKLALRTGDARYLEEAEPENWSRAKWGFMVV